MPARSWPGRGCSSVPRPWTSRRSAGYRSCWSRPAPRQGRPWPPDSPLRRIQVCLQSGGVDGRESLALDDVLADANPDRADRSAGGEGEIGPPLWLQGARATDRLLDRLLGDLDRTFGGRPRRARAGEPPNDDARAAEKQERGDRREDPDPTIRPSGSLRLPTRHVASPRVTNEGTPWPLSRTRA